MRNSRKIEQAAGWRPGAPESVKVPRWSRTEGIHNPDMIDTTGTIDMKGTGHDY